MMTNSATTSAGSRPSWSTVLRTGLGAINRPWALALIVALFLRLIVALAFGSDLVLAPLVMIALFFVARTGERRPSLTVAVICAVVSMVGVAWLEDEVFWPELAGEMSLMLLPIAVADGIRSRADRIADTIEAEAAARVQTERLRIARDLHDVVAHGLSTIAIQSGVAAHLIEKDPAMAKQALETINATGKSSLEELRAMVGVLRSTDEMPLRPTPSDPNDLTDVLAGAAAAGLDVTPSVRGAFPVGVGDLSVVAVHRIIQEALTNVARHAGPVAAKVVIEHGTDGVELTITNAGALETGSPAQPKDKRLATTGVGIIGMTERAEALGGSLHAGPLSAGGFRVVATVPYHQKSMPIEESDVR